MSDTKTVKRYQDYLRSNTLGGLRSDMREKMYGQYVHFSDYQALEKQNQDLREALEFYANRSNYSLNGECGLDINSSGPKGYIRDFGNMARSALGQQTDAYLNPPQAASEQDKD